MSSDQMICTSTTVELIVSDSRFVSLGSQWGHSVIAVDGIVYGMSTVGFDIRAKSMYLERNAFRDSMGVVPRISNNEKQKILQHLRKKQQNPEPYDIMFNSYATSDAETLELIGILAHDPRFQLDPESNARVSPKELLTMVSRSKRVASKNFYPKNE